MDVVLTPPGIESARREGVARTASVLFGRERETADLRKRVDRALAGSGGAVLVTGEVGAGVTSLVSSALAEPARTGVPVWRGAADELGRRLPLLPFLECRTGDGRALYRSSPDLAELARTAGGAVSLAATSGLLLEAVEEQCARGPLALVIDDAQWLDDASVALWRRLARAAEDLPLLLVAGVRHRLWSRPVESLVVAARLAGDVIELGPLPSQAVLALAGHRLGAAAGESLTTLLAQAGGNPGYLLELLDVLDRQGGLRRSGAAVELAEGGAVPAFTELAELRLAELSPGAAMAVREAALLGRRARMADLAAVTGQSTTELVGAVREAVSAGLLAESEDGLTFRHPMLWRGIRESVPDVLRWSMHVDTARRLAESGAEPVRVAEQLEQAGPVLDGWAVGWVRRHASVLVEQAPELAVPVLRAAAGDGQLDDRAKVLQAALARAMLRARRYDQALELARNIVASTADPVLTAEVAWDLARSLHLVGGHTEAGRLCEEQLTRDGVPPALRARLAACLVYSLMVLGEPVEHRLAAAEATADALVRASGDPWASGGLMLCRAVAARAAGDDERALALLSQADDVLSGPEDGRPELRAVVLSELADLLGESDERVQSDAAQARANASAARSRTHNSQWTAVAGFALHLRNGAWDLAGGELAELCRPDEPQPMLSAHCAYAVQQAVCAPPEGASAQLRLAQQVAGARAVGRSATLLRAAEAIAAERAGDSARALRALEGELTAERAPGAAYRLVWCPRAVRYALDCDHLELAERFVGFARESATAQPLPHRVWVLAWCEALVAADDARLCAVAEYFRSAGRRTQLAWVLEDLAALRAATGQTASARMTLAEALQLYRDLGALAEARRAEQRLRAAGVEAVPRRRTGRGRAAAGWEALTPTELTVAHLAGRGLSNPQIAERLGISARTVQTHVSGILGKLGATSRVAIAQALVRREESPTGG
ncbi:AAA family ATPase [Kitasatospora sp. NPDC058190]|uniref:helix-turn-helix transcriptional regulator n=1 Tax=Kitasatospora sp. NPDC058190 TaxID=3346371 RepID=UPI0036DCF5CA